MRKIANIAWLNLTQVVKDRTGLFTLIALPLMLTFLFGTIMGGGERRAVIAVADLDRTSLSREVVSVFDPRSYDVRAADEKTARAMAASGEALAALVIPVHFESDVLSGADTTVTVVKDPRSTIAIAPVQALRGRVQRISANAQTISIVTQAYRDASAAAGTVFAPPAPRDVYTYADDLWSPTPPLSTTETAVARSRVRASSETPMGFQQYSLGFTLMFMMFMGMGAAGGFLDDREQGTLARLLATPTRRVSLVAGKVLGIYLTVLLQAGIMVGFGATIFHVPWGDDPLGVTMLLAAFGLAVTGLGVMISTLARTRGQISALTAVGATAMSMLGGAYWPLDIVNPTMRLIAFMTPVGWAMTGLTNVVVRMQGATTAVVPTLALLAMAAVFLTIGVARLRLE